MKSNLGTTDNIIRVLAFLAAVTLYLMKITSGVFGITLIVVGTVLLLTSLLNYCPLYSIPGISTKTKK